MKKIGVALGMIVSTVVNASAADLPSHAAPPLPPLVPAVLYDWSGFYVGGNVGAAFNAGGYKYNMPFTGPGNTFAACGSPAGVAPLAVAAGPNPFVLSSSCSRNTTVIAGGQIGYNWKAGSNWLFGVEGDGEWQRLIDRSYVRFGNNPSPGAPLGSVATDTSYFRSTMGPLGTFRGRVGYTFNEWMIYATGGLAVGSVKHSVTEVLAPGTICVTQGAGCQSSSADKTKVGFTVGAGAEWMLAKNWSIGAEYLFVDLGRTSVNLIPQGFANFQNPSFTLFADREHIARLKLNYHFSTLVAPVVARY